MTTNINKIINDWIGEGISNTDHTIHCIKGISENHQHCIKNLSHKEQGYNQALQDLRYRIPELEEKIVKIIKKQKRSKQNALASGLDAEWNDAINHVIKTLTSKE